MGVICSPMPSTQALRPRRKNGTSAPSARPICASCASGSSGPTGGSAPAGRSPRPTSRRPCPPVPARACRSRCARPGWRPRPAAGRGRRAGPGRRPATAAPRSSRLRRAVGAQLEMQRVAPVDQHEDRLQQVHAVGPAPDDVQEEVELGGRRNVVECLHAVLQDDPQVGLGRAARARLAATRPWANWDRSALPAGHRRVDAAQPVEQGRHRNGSAGDVGRPAHRPNRIGGSAPLA